MKFNFSPIIYFLDNGFRNQALNNFLPLENRNDVGLLIESFIFQELLKLQVNHHANFNIFYWRTRSGAEIDFVLQGQQLIPVEVKFQNFEKSTISKSFRSFIEAYQPENSFILTKNYHCVTKVNATQVHFISINQFDRFLEKIGIFLI